MKPQEQQVPDTEKSLPNYSKPIEADARRPRSRLSVIGFVLAILVPPLGAIVSIIAWREIRKKALAGKRLTVFGAIWGIIFSVPFLFFLWLFIMFGGLKSNGAHNVAKPFMGKIEQAGGKKICDNGNSGYGIDNDQPWYRVYYRISDSSGLTNEIESIAKQQGYDLEKDRAIINQLQGRAAYALPGDEQFNPDSDYLTGQGGGRTLTVIINRRASVSLNCSSGKYGRKEATGNTTAILDISFELPVTNRGD